MIRNRLGRVAAILSSAALVLSLGIGTASAATPNWDIEITPTPSAVGVGKDAGFIVVVKNNGPSQINALSVTVTPTDTPSAPWSYRGPLVYNVGGPATCGSTVPLTCQLGTFVAGQTVTFTVAYPVPLSQNGNFDLKVAIKAGTGDTPSDGPKNTSRGDAYDESGFATVRGGDFDGGFQVGGDSYQTNPALGNRNIQSTALSGAPEGVPVMIEDGIATLAACDSVTDDVACAGLFGEWSRLNVNNGNGGANFATPFKVTLMVRGGPGGNADVQFVHVLDDGSIDVVDETCIFAGTNPVPTNAECLVATKVGSNWKIDVWLLRNGFGRGGI